MRTLKTYPVSAERQIHIDRNTISKQSLAVKILNN